MTLMWNKFFPPSVQKDLATENDWTYILAFCDKRISKVMISFVKTRRLELDERDWIIVLSTQVFSSFFNELMQLEFGYV